MQQQESAQQLSRQSQLVLITGGSRGIGRELVIRFSQEGYRVAFTFCQQATRARELEQRLGDRVKGFRFDQADSEQVTPLLEAIAGHFGQRVDVLVNNAAIAQEKPFATITADDWSTMLATNLQGPFLLAQACLPAMLDKGWGRIINISSIGGQWGGFNQVHYAASKAGLISLTQSLAKIYSSQGITANAIAIGLVATDMTANELSTEAGQRKLAGIPAGRAGTAGDIAEIALFLASAGSGYLTGQTLNANGGMYFG